MRTTTTNLIALIITITLTGLGWAQDLDLFIQPSEELAQNGSVELFMEMPDEELSERLLWIDDVLVARGEAVADGFVLNTAILENGRHPLVLEAITEDGRWGWAETWIEVENPEVTITKMSAPEVVWPDSEITIDLEIVGGVDGIEADFSSLSSDAPSAEVELLDENIFRLHYWLPGHADGNQGWHQIPIEIIDPYGRTLRTGTRVFLADGPTLPIASKVGYARLESIDTEADPESQAWVINTSEELELRRGETGWLGLEIEGLLDGGELLIGIEGYSGHLVVPMDTLEDFVDEENEPEEEPEPEWQNRELSLPLELQGIYEFADPMQLWVNVRDFYGRLGDRKYIPFGPLPEDPNALSVTLTWQSPVDLDLQITEPGGEIISSSNTTSQAGGRLVIEADCRTSGQRAERIHWTSAPIGSYDIKLGYATWCGGLTTINYTLEIKGAGINQVHRGSMALSNQSYQIQGPYFTVAPNTVKVSGTIKYTHPNDFGVSVASPAGGVRVEVLDRSGAVVGSEHAWSNGDYSIRFPRPASQANTPYSIRLATDYSVYQTEARVVPMNSSTAHTFSPSTTWNPLQQSAKQLDVTIAQASSGAFHIHRFLVKGMNYIMRKPGLSRTTAEWSKGQRHGCWTCYDKTADRIYISGMLPNPDEFDESVFLRELGLRAVHHLSRDDSSTGRSKSRNRYQSPELALSEGFARYIANSTTGWTGAIDRAKGGAKLFYINSLYKVPRSTQDGTESGDISHALFAAYLWDLNDPHSGSEDDWFKNGDAKTMRIFQQFRTTAKLDRGVKGAADPADFVKAYACPMNSGDRSSMDIMLTNRFGLDWMTNDTLCK